MAPTKRKTKHMPEKTKVGEQVLDLLIPYIHNGEDRNSVSLVSRNFYEIDRITRKRVTVHALYYPDPASLSNRFPFIESLTLKGPPSGFNKIDHYDMKITSWIQQLALEFRCLKELHIRGLVVHDEDLETLARTRGKDLRSLKIKKCKGISRDGLMHISMYCSQLRTLCLKYNDYHIEAKDVTWLHQLALNSTALEMLKFNYTDISDAEGLTLLAKNCCNSLISLKLGECYVTKLGDAFRYAVRLEHFSGRILDVGSDLDGFRLPPNMHSLSIKDLPITQYSIILPFSNMVRKLKVLDLDYKCHCILFKSCPNLEVLYTEDVCGDKGLQVIGKFCKKLRKLTHTRLVTHAGLIALAKGCTKLECLKVTLKNTSNVALEFVGTHLKNLRKLCMTWITLNGTVLPLDYGVRAILKGCSKLERLDISLRYGGLTDVGLGYIGEYGVNLRSLSLTRIGKFNAGLVKLSQGCPKLRKLKLIRCLFSEQVVTSSVFNIRSLRYVWGYNSDDTALALTRPEVYEGPS